MIIRRVFQLFFALTLSLLISELFVAKVVGYPVYGVRYKVRYRKGAETWTNIRKPHSQVYNVEGRIKTSFNNLGIPGVDVKRIVNPIVVLGSSYIEALQFVDGSHINSLGKEHKTRKFAQLICEL